MKLGNHGIHGKIKGHQKRDLNRGCLGIEGGMVSKDE